LETITMSIAFGAAQERHRIPDGRRRGCRPRQLELQGAPSAIGHDDSGAAGLEQRGFDDEVVAVRPVAFLLFDH
jgi:hypothetical protein